MTPPGQGLPLRSGPSRRLHHPRREEQLLDRRVERLSLGLGLLLGRLKRPGGSGDLELEEQTTNFVRRLVEGDVTLSTEVTTIP